EVADRPFGIYIHVPFCATRCGYCDFNTYTPGELGAASSPESWLEAMRVELGLAAAAMAAAGAPAPPVQTVYNGGGTHSLLGGKMLAEMRDAVRNSYPLARSEEMTPESNPESTSPRLFETLRAAGYTRISLGMQSAAAHVMQVLDRV